MRVAIVGGGFAGAACADVLRRRLGGFAQLVVFERGSRVGGRVDDRQIGGVRVETGATLFHSSNRLVVRAAEELGLASMDVAAVPHTIGIWDGEAFVLRTAGSAVGDVLRMLRRYGLSLLHSSRMVRSMVRLLEGVYPRLDAGAAWSSPASLLGELGLAGMCRERAWDRFRGAGISPRFIGEFIDGVSRNNYGQDASTLSAFAGLVSLAGAGLGGGSLRRIREGNRQICAGLFHRADAEMRTGASVTALRRERSQWVVEVEAQQMNADLVVLAAPLELAELSVEGLQTVAPPRSYKTIHATFVRGRLQPGYFGAYDAPDFILTTAEVEDPLSVEQVGETTDAEPLYKVFSREPIDDYLLEQMFIVNEAVRIVWRAYPELPPSSAWAPFRIAGRLYYASALEYAISTMETQAIAGAATANLIAADLSNRPVSGEQG